MDKWFKLLVPIMPFTKYHALHAFVLLLLIYLVIFLKLNAFHMRWWDESMFAVNTYEMLHNHKYFSYYFDGQPDVFNTKPPLAIWLQLVFVKLLGYNELALRLPSAIAAALCVIIVFVFMQKRFGWLYAWLSALMLLTAQGFNSFHTTRTADSDALLTLFVFTANIYFLKYVYQQKSKYIFYFFVFLMLTFCTKLYAALLFAPAYLVILWRYKKLKAFVLNPFCWLGFAVFMVCSVAVIYLRELDTPGYTKEIFFKDAGRLFNVVESHSQSWHYYFDNLATTRFAIWFVVLLLGACFAVLKRRDEHQRLFFDVLILCAVYLFIISCSVTKLEWYDMPLYPLFAMLCAFGFHNIMVQWLPLTFNSRAVLLLLIIFAYPYWLMFRQSQANTIGNGEKQLEANERFLFNASQNLDGTKVYFDGWPGALLFYKYKLAEQGQKITLVKISDFKPNDRVLLSSDSLYNVIKNNYQFTELAAEGPARLLQIQQLRGE